MTLFSRWTSANAALLALGLVCSTITPFVVSTSATAQEATQQELTDIRNHWARPFIERLAEENIITGFPDGTFKPNQPVTRAQFAAIVRKAFSKESIRTSRGFSDVRDNYWAAQAIEEAYETGFLSGYPGNQFRPEEQIPRVQALVSLSSGLGLSANQPTAQVLDTYADANRIPDYADDAIAAATANKLVVNYPNVNYLNPNEVATRGDIAAFIYQALVNQGELQPVSDRLDVARYIVGGTSTTASTGGQTGNNTQTNQNPQARVQKGTTVNVKYEQSDRVVVAPGETIDLALAVAEPVRNAQGQIVIPANSRLEGQLIPRYSGSNFLGTQFVAQRVIVGNQTYSNINATSQLVTAQKPANVPAASLEDAALTAAARTIADTVLGRPVRPADILTTVITGRQPGASTTQTAQNSLVIIDPENDLRLTFGSDFYASSNTGS